MTNPNAIPLISWIRSIWHWLTEIPTFWTFLAVFVIAVCLPLLLVANADDALRYAGLLLQLLGVGVVAFTLRERGKLFGRTPVIKFAYKWVRRGPNFRPRNITLKANCTGIAITSDTVDATIWRSPRLDQSIEAQLEAIRENIDMLRVQVETQDSRTGAQIANLRKIIDAEHNQRSDQIHETRKTLEGLAAESLYLEVAGLAWLVNGIVLATVPTEIASLLKWLFL